MHQDVEEPKLYHAVAEKELNAVMPVLPLLIGLVLCKGSMLQVQLVKLRRLCGREVVL
jgi:hypothetical protein